METTEAPLMQTEGGFHIWDKWAVELETAGLLTSLVMQSKPDLIVEAGTGRGIATSFLAQGVLFNKKGRIVTFEDDDGYFEQAKQNLESLECVEVLAGNSVNTELKPDFVFVDSYGIRREPVIQYWLTRSWNPLVIVHDATRKYRSLKFGEGVYIPGHDGVWIGRPRVRSVGINHLSL